VGKCQDVCIKLQLEGVSLVFDVYLLPLGGYDAVLGA
jgi:hypothetical protein